MFYQIVFVILTGANRPIEQITEYKNRLVHIDKSWYIRGGIINQGQKGSAGTTGYLHEKENKIRSLPHIVHKRKFHTDWRLKCTKQSFKISDKSKGSLWPKSRED